MKNILENINWFFEIFFFSSIKEFFPLFSKKSTGVPFDSNCYPFKDWRKNGFDSLDSKYFEKWFYRFEEKKLFERKNKQDKYKPYVWGVKRKITRRLFLVHRLLSAPFPHFPIARRLRSILCIRWSRRGIAFLWSPPAASVSSRARALSTERIQTL